MAGTTHPTALAEPELLDSVLDTFFRSGMAGLSWTETDHPHSPRPTHQTIQQKQIHRTNQHRLLQ